MSTYQIYDFIKDIDFHIKKKTPINLEKKSKIFKSYLFELKMFHFTNKIEKTHPVFNQDYFLFILNNVAHVAKKIDGEELKFDYVEILDGLKTIRKLKLKKLFY